MVGLPTTPATAPTMESAAAPCQIVTVRHLGLRLFLNHILLTEPLGRLKVKNIYRLSPLTSRQDIKPGSLTDKRRSMAIDLERHIN